MWKTIGRNDGLSRKEKQNTNSQPARIEASINWSGFNPSYSLNSFPSRITKVWFYERKKMKQRINSMNEYYEISRKDNFLSDEEENFMRSPEQDLSFGSIFQLIVTK